ncbi:LysR family transcriptional regulator [Noviherbaspirillum sedimenti]|uniref:LysR family transcriptional regulator n=1 Tax=Noviherbaspirillum sedimenti TaxID=2320865 RepID=UPI001313EB65|nr:LysR family transcriptional regulator [Noviherbaspirillum sedimenti]
MNLLPVFEVVYAERNLSRAAKRLGLTQSAVSNALARLREALGQPLFVRAGQGVAPTAYADAIAADVIRALEGLRASLRPVRFDQRLSNRRFTLICSDYSIAVILPPVLARVQLLAPQAELQVVSKHDGKDFGQALAQGEADLALGGIPFLVGTMRQQRLFEENTVVLARRGHPALAGKPGLEVLNRYPHVLVNPYGNWLPWENLAQVQGISIDPRFAVRMQTYLAAPYLLESTDYLASCPQRLAALLSRHFPLAVLPLPTPLVTTPIGQYWHERSQEDPGHQWLRQQVYEVCQGI